MTKKLKSLKTGEFFTLKDIPEPNGHQVFVKENYDRSEKKFWCMRWDDISDGRYLSGDKDVYVDFIF